MSAVWRPHVYTQSPLDHCADSGLTHEPQAPPLLGTRVLQVWGPTVVISENRLAPPMVPKKMEEG